VHGDAFSFSAGDILLTYFHNHQYESQAIKRVNEVVGRDERCPACGHRRRGHHRAELGTAPLLARVYRWQGGIPRYAVGHLERVRRAEQRLESLPGVVLADTAYRGIGVPDCIRQGEKAARAVLT
jgi:hypothetical protein